MLPKIIHYCWFGGKDKPESVLEYINTWKKCMPEYEIKEWNESNFNVESLHFTSQAYMLHKYAFISDYVRMKALYEYGGLYLDTDIKMLKSLDPLCEKGSFVGMEIWDCYGTGVIGANKGEDWLRRMMKYYETQNFIGWFGLPHSIPNTQVLTKMYPNHSLPVTIYPIDYLTAKDWKTGEYMITDNTYCIHDYSKTWLRQKPINHKVMRMQNVLQLIKWFIMRFKTLCFNRRKLMSYENFSNK